MPNMIPKTLERAPKIHKTDPRPPMKVSKTPQESPRSPKKTVFSPPTLGKKVHGA